MQPISIDVAPPYNFAASVRDHGWPSLAPNRWLPENNALQRVERLSNGRTVLLCIAASSTDEGEGGENGGDASVRVCVETRAAHDLAEAERHEIQAMVRWMLKLDEDLAHFYARAREHPDIWRQVRSGRGRLLRSPTLWEDVVKTIATTNVTWTNTCAMIERLVAQLGDPFPLDPTLRAFPTPEAVAAADPALFSTEIRMGYRNAYVQQLAREIATGDRDLEALKCADLSAAELKKELKSIKGVGDYAAHTLLMLLGHYGELAIDSELRSFVTARYFPEGEPTPKEMAAIYESWSDWKYLAYWFDATT